MYYIKMLFKWFKRVFNWFIRLYDWFKRLLKWFYDGYLFWTYFLMIIVLYHFTHFYLYFGTILQLFGIVIIVYGINKKIKLFNNEKPLKYHLKYFLRIPSFNAKQHVKNLSSSVHLSMSATGNLTSGVRRPDQSYADIIRYVDEELLKINKQILKIKIELNNQITDLTKQLNDNRKQLESNINAVEKKLVYSNTSDISLELFGAGCIAAGLIFSILPLIK